MDGSLNDLFLKEYKYIFKKYKPIKKIGEGSFGNIYSVIRLKDKSAFAMKTERIDAKEKMLESEAYTLYNIQKGFGIPKIITYGHNQNYNILIETLLGDSLENIFIKRKSKCNIIDVCAIGIQIIDRLEWIHSKDIIYRDVKPENFLIGINDPNVIYIIDFGLCKKYRSSKTGKHILPKMNKNFHGNFKFSSSNALKGKESSRRDDIISLGYMLIYLIKKGLPWDYIYKNNKITSSKYFELVFLKETNFNGKLFNDLPSEFKEFAQYAENLKFEEDPDYSYLRSILNKIIENNNFTYEKYHFSWINYSKKDKDFSVSKKNYSKKKSLHQRILQSLEEISTKNNNSIKNESNNLLRKHNISSQIHYALNSFKDLNFKENNFSNEFNTKGDEKRLKTGVITESKLYNNKSRNYIPIKLRFMNKKDVNKNKINQDSSVKEKYLIINKKIDKEDLYDNYSNSHSKNIISNSKISPNSFIPKNNYINDYDYMYNEKKKLNNIIKGNNAPKSKIILKNKLNSDLSHTRNNFSEINDKFQNLYFGGFSNKNM